VTRHRLPGNVTPIVPIAITERVFVFGAVALLLVAFSLSAMMGVVAFGAMRELSATREALQQTEKQAEICKTALTRSEAKLEQVGDLLTFASKRGRSAIGGGP